MMADTVILTAQIMSTIEDAMKRFIISVFIFSLLNLAQPPAIAAQGDHDLRTTGVGDIFADMQRNGCGR
jgi:hypothetical protein